MNVSVLIGTILYHLTGISLFVALIVELWRYFVDKTMTDIQQGTADPNSTDWEQVERYSILKSVFQTDQTLQTHTDHDAKEHRRRSWYLQKQKFVHRLLLIGHYVAWGIKLLLPTFLVGSPSLFDNIRVILKEERFRPMRWFIFFWVLIGIVALIAFRLFFFVE